jgi:hypothetical protein
MLTVISAALMCLFVQNAVRPTTVVSAQNNNVAPTHVIIEGWSPNVGSLPYLPVHVHGTVSVSVSK